jgi:hypothetical protein
VTCRTKAHRSQSRAKRRWLASGSEEALDGHLARCLVDKSPGWLGSQRAALRRFPRNKGRDRAAKDARENGKRPAWHVTPGRVGGAAVERAGGRLHSGSIATESLSHSVMPGQGQAGEPGGVRAGLVREIACQRSVRAQSRVDRELTLWNSLFLRSPNGERFLPCAGELVAAAASSCDSTAGATAAGGASASTSAAVGSVTAEVTPVGSMVVAGVATWVDICAGE